VVLFATCNKIKFLIPAEVMCLDVESGVLGKRFLGEDEIAEKYVISS
jgi:hypothetical protein